MIEGHSSMVGALIYPEVLPGASDSPVWQKWKLRISDVATTKIDAVNFLAGLITSSETQIQTAKSKLADEQSQKIQALKDQQAAALAEFVAGQDAAAEELRKTLDDEMENVCSSMTASVDKLNGIVGLLSLLPDSSQA